MRSVTRWEVLFQTLSQYKFDIHYKDRGAETCRRSNISRWFCRYTADGEIKMTLTIKPRVLGAIHHLFSARIAALRYVAHTCT
jgi:hypothetical protein